MRSNLKRLATSDRENTYLKKRTFCFQRTEQTNYSHTFTSLKIEVLAEIPHLNLIKKAFGSKDKYIL